jgi:hypothetical protein
MGRRVWDSRQGGKAILPDLLRALGLRSFVHLFHGLRHLFGNHQKTPEAPKQQLLHRSRLYATIRSIVHLIPMTIFACMLFLNYRTVYYSPGLSVFDRNDAPYFALFQVAAKMVELICLASLSTILLRVLRGDLLYGEGVSLGLLASSPWFASPIYLLSPEFLSAVQISLARWWQLLRRFRFVRSAGARLEIEHRNININTSTADVEAGNYDRHVKLTTEWLDLLTPTAPDPPSTNDSWQPNTLENIFHAAGFDMLMEELRYQTAIMRNDDGCGFGTIDSSLTDQELWDRKVCQKGNKVN